MIEIAAPVSTSICTGTSWICNWTDIGRLDDAPKQYIEYSGVSGVLVESATLCVGLVAGVRGFCVVGADSLLAF